MPDQTRRRLQRALLHHHQPRQRPLRRVPLHHHRPRRRSLRRPLLHHLLPCSRLSLRLPPLSGHARVFRTTYNARKSPLMALSATTRIVVVSVLLWPLQLRTDRRSLILHGKPLCKRSFRPFSTPRRGRLFHVLPAPTLSAISEFSKSSNILMALLTSTKPAWSLAGSLSSMVLTISTRLVQLSNQLLFALCSHSLFRRVGVCDNLM